MQFERNFHHLCEAEPFRENRRRNAELHHLLMRKKHAILKA